MDKPLKWPKAEARVSAGLPTFASISKDLAQVPLGRRIATLLFILLAVLLARFSWETPIVVTDPDGSKHHATIPIATDAERALYDTRAAYAAIGTRKVSQDKRILLIPFTPDSQFRTGKRSPLDRTTLAQALTDIDSMGAKAIGIDILFDQAQPDDAPGTHYALGLHVRSSPPLSSHRSDMRRRSGLPNCCPQTVSPGCGPNLVGHTVVVCKP